MKGKGHVLRHRHGKPAPTTAAQCTGLVLQFERALRT